MAQLRIEPAHDQSRLTVSSGSSLRANLVLELDEAQTFSTIEATLVCRQTGRYGTRFPTRVGHVCVASELELGPGTHTLDIEVPIASGVQLDYQGELFSFVHQLQVKAKRSWSPALRLRAPVRVVSARPERRVVLKPSKTGNSMGAEIVWFFFIASGLTTCFGSCLLAPLLAWRFWSRWAALITILVGGGLALALTGVGVWIYCKQRAPIRPADALRAPSEVPEGITIWRSHRTLQALRATFFLDAKGALCALLECVPEHTGQLVRAEVVLEGYEYVHDSNHLVNPHQYHTFHRQEVVLASDLAVRAHQGFELRGEVDIPAHAPPSRPYMAVKILWKVCLRLQFAQGPVFEDNIPVELHELTPTSAHS